MAGKSTPMLLVTANVGSIFEDPTIMLKIWIEEFLSTVSRLDPKFIALHCQEVGGKNYERSMKHVEYFVRLLMSSEELRLFDRVRVYLDEDYSSAEHFTALGNFYFIHESVPDVLMWDFPALAFVTVKGKDIHSGNIEAVSTKEKSKFPQDFFPECKWSRKGFLRTRWNINGTIFDLINIHLFHDASNFIAMESFPSVYCKNRRRALEHTLDRFHNDDNGNAPFVVFGDFNFRIDTQGVVKKLAEGLNPVRLQSNKNADLTKLQYRDSASQVILSLGKKEFSHQEHQKVFVEDVQWLKEFDKELEPFSSRLFEFGVKFPPSYPFEENEKGAKRYMQTRCPSWCDRVILSYTAKSLISDPCSIEYGLMGVNTCMGDHKPVFLKMDLIPNAGMISCCTYHHADCESPPCFGRTVLPYETNARNSSFWSYKHSFCAQRANTALVIEPNPNTHFLALPQSALSHEPYTPESIDTPSSSPVPSHGDQSFQPANKRLLEKEDLFECGDVVREISENFISYQMKIDSPAIADMCEPIINYTESTKPNVPEEFQHFPQSDILQSVQQSTQVTVSPKPAAKSSSLLKYMSYSSLGHMSTLLSALEKNVERSYSTNRIENIEFDTCMSSEQNSVHGLQTCRCLSDTWPRKGIPSDSMNTQPKIRVRLISGSSSHSARLQSHHSSSDEDWFEEVGSNEERTGHSTENVTSVDGDFSAGGLHVTKETGNIKHCDPNLVDGWHQNVSVDTIVIPPVSLNLNNCPSSLLCSVACDKFDVKNKKLGICDSVLSLQKKANLIEDSKQMEFYAMKPSLLDNGKFSNDYNSKESDGDVISLESEEMLSFTGQSLDNNIQRKATDLSKCGSSVCSRNDKKQSKCCSFL